MKIIKVSNNKNLFKNQNKNILKKSENKQIEKKKCKLCDILKNQCN
jgi:hypothetical protein